MREASITDPDLARQVFPASRSDSRGCRNALSASFTTAAARVHDLMGGP